MHTFRINENTSGQVDVDAAYFVLTSDPDFVEFSLGKEGGRSDIVYAIAASSVKTIRRLGDE